MRTPVKTVLDRLKGVRQSGKGWTALCPCPDHGNDGVDTHPSLSVTQGDDGQVLLKCLVGCDTRNVLAALDLTWADLFPDRGDCKRKAGITLADLACHKGLPVHFLEGLGLHDLPGGVVGIPYRDSDGQTTAVKRRTALAAKEGFLWPRGRSLLPYGLDKLAQREADWLLLVEGETDALTAWHHHLPCLGIPGANGTGCLQAGHLEGISKLLIWQEPDPGGENFVRGIARRLRELSWQGEAKVLQPAEGLKDLNELHHRYLHDAGAFKVAFEQMVETAKLLPEPKSGPSGGAPILPVVRRLADVEAKPIRWLWQGRFARGKASFLAGHPGLGKSQVTISLAAVVSTGGCWPVDGSPCETGSVVFLSAEDDPADTIRPRLEAAGADIHRCYVLEAARAGYDGRGEMVSRPFSLETDLPQLEALLDHIGDVALVVIDPISAYLGDTDSHRNSDVRALLAPLSQLAARQEVAVVCVTHLSKAGGADALLRVVGSIGFAAAPRAAYLVAKDAERPERRLFLPLKNNLVKGGAGLAFRVAGHDLPGGIETSRVLWEGQPVTVTADEALATADEDRSALNDAKEFLATLLADGPVPTEQVRAEAKGAGYSWRTIQRAKKALGAEAIKEGMAGGWVWRLPPKNATPPEECQGKMLAPFGDPGGLRAAEPLGSTACGTGPEQPTGKRAEEPQEQTPPSGWRLTL